MEQKENQFRAIKGKPLGKENRYFLHLVALLRVPACSSLYPEHDAKIFLWDTLNTQKNGKSFWHFCSCCETICLMISFVMSVWNSKPEEKFFIILLRFLFVFCFSILICWGWILEETLDVHSENQEILKLPSNIYSIFKPALISFNQKINF